MRYPADVCGFRIKVWPRLHPHPRARPGKWIARQMHENCYTIVIPSCNYQQTNALSDHRCPDCGDFVSMAPPWGGLSWLFGGISQERYPNFGGGGIVIGDLSVCKLTQDQKRPKRKPLCFIPEPSNSPQKKHKSTGWKSPCPTYKNKVKRKKRKRIEKKK